VVCPLLISYCLHRVVGKPTDGGGLGILSLSELKRDQALVSAGGAVLQGEGNSHEERRQILESRTPNRSPYDRTYSFRSLSSIDGLDG